MMKSTLRSVLPRHLYNYGKFFYRIPTYWPRERAINQRLALGLDRRSIPYDNEIIIRAPEALWPFIHFESQALSSECRKEMDTFLKLATGCSRFIDIGANAGFFSAMFARSRSAESRIISVEPDPEALVFLKEVRRDNVPSRCTWQISEAAIADSDGRVRLSKVPFGLNPRIVENDRYHDEQYFEARCRRMESFCDEHDIIPDIIKIDVESFEFEIISDSLSFLNRVRPRLHVEIHWTMISDRGESPADLLRMLHGAGYAGILRRERDLLMMASQPPINGVSRLSLKHKDDRK